MTEPTFTPDDHATYARDRYQEAVEHAASKMRNLADDLDSLANAVATDTAHPPLGENAARVVDKVHYAVVHARVSDLVRFASDADQAAAKAAAAP